MGTCQSSGGPLAYVEQDVPMTNDHSPSMTMDRKQRFHGAHDPFKAILYIVDGHLGLFIVLE